MQRREQNLEKDQGQEQPRLQPAVQFRGSKGYKAMEEACAIALEARKGENEELFQPYVYMDSQSCAMQQRECVKLPGQRPAARIFAPVDLNSEQGRKMIEKALSEGYKINGFEDHELIKQFTVDQHNEQPSKSALEDVALDQMEQIKDDFYFISGWTCRVDQEGQARQVFKGKVMVEKIYIYLDRDATKVKEQWEVTYVGKESVTLKSHTNNPTAELCKMLQSVRGFRLEGTNSEIQNLLRILAEDALPEKIYTASGWQRVAGRYCYLFDNMKGVSCESGHKIYIRDDVSTMNILESAIAVFKDTTLCGPFILTSLLGPTAYLFKQVDRQPTSILMVVGRTGSLKTAVSKAFFTLFNTLEQPSLHSFQSTIAALEPAIEEFQDATLLVDDFSVNAMGNPMLKNTMIGVLDALVRYYGDATSKRKSSRDGQMVEMPRPCGGAVVTGEIASEAHSSILRMIVLRMEPQVSVDGERLNYLQTNLDLYPTLVYRYISFLEENFNQCTKLIQTRYQDYREEAKSFSISEKRSIDHYVEYKLLWVILQEFLRQSCSYKESDRIDQIGDLFIRGVVHHIKQTEAMANNTDPTTRLFLVIREVIDDALCAENKDQYKMNPCQYLGFHKEENHLLVKKDLFERAVEAAMKREGIVSPGWRRLAQQLCDCRIIERQPNGKNMTYCTKVKLLQDTQAFYVLNLSALDMALKDVKS